MESLMSGLIGSNETPAIVSTLATCQVAERRRNQRIWWGNFLTEQRGPRCRYQPVPQEKGLPENEDRG